MRVVTFKIEETLLEQLDAYAIKHNLDRSSAIRKAISEMIQKEYKSESESFRVKIEKFRL